ncbi:MAG: RdgB/HAM1 family non-canonical purine NTP pyrophosphatase [Clostridia bacterium]|nr:RdgB/HAM1 family non-canonical purine NTP pyrophosphatase [Clostridia bacterium]
MKFVIATHNTHKLEEFERILTPLGVQIALRELSDVEETGETFAENAFLKAESAMKETGLPAIADDSGLMVDALNGAPGVYSARYAGEGGTYDDVIRKLLFEMRDVPEENRTARFVSSICCVFPDGETLRAEGVCEGMIAFEKRGEGGFGYDPVFLVGDRSFAEMTGAEKDAVSHRGRALRAFSKILEERIGKED